MTTILTADDDARLRALVAATLEQDDWVVVEAANGDSAWDLLRAQIPAVAILDIYMPGRNGLELAAAIKEAPELRGVRVIMLTARNDRAGVAAAQAAGVEFYLTKPFPPLELLRAVEHLLDGPTH